VALLVFRKYLLLVRLPNTFTAPSNILTGYFAVIPPWHANVSVLAILMASSALLYVSGIVFNDFFDIEIDRKERPFRPLPSNEITKQKALIIATVSMIIANLLAFAAGTASLIVAIILSATIIGYDYRLKRTMAGPVTMGSARFLNIFLGASPGLAGLFFYNDDFLIARLLLVCILMLLYVLAISILSRMEVGVAKSKRSVIGPFLIIFARWII
jgi:4-hydroxybenzoate polyprenyltransferase